jgi:FkbH-like protein
VPGARNEPRALERAIGLQRAGRLEEALGAYLDALAGVEVPEASVAVRVATCAAGAGDSETAWCWLQRVADAPGDFVAAQAGAALLKRLRATHAPAARRRARAAVVGTYTTTQFTTLLPLWALRLGVDLEVREAPYAQMEQELLDGNSATYRFDPDFIVLATHDAAVSLPVHSDDPEGQVAREAERWINLWRAIERHGRARPVMHGFVLPAHNAFGHLSSRLAGSRQAMLIRLNQALGAAAGDAVSLVDCEAVAGALGKGTWCDPRYWFLSKQAVALAALPALCRSTAMVIAADLGLSRKCIVLDLDNTLWGGVVGEDGLAGIALGAGPAGEAFVAFQHQLRRLRQRGVILAVCSKNNDADAREPFQRHPDMVLALEDIAVFQANWDPKPLNLQRIAARLDLGLDALLFVDDNPAEREAVRQALPDVEVLVLPAEPALYVAALAAYPLLEPASFTEEDSQRSDQYRARAMADDLKVACATLEDFHRSLRMECMVRPFDELHLPRIAQLIAKTNQFNLTTRRHTAAAVRQMMGDPQWVHLCLRLRDRFADHGLVGVLIARRDGETLDIDTWLMSCRVIGRTVEAEMLAHLCGVARRLGCTVLRGTYVPTARNGMVSGIYERFGFRRVGEEDGEMAWEYDIGVQGPIANGFIAPWKEELDDAA